MTIPMAIITTKDVLITVCLEGPDRLPFMDGRVRNCIYENKVYLTDPL